MSTSMFPYAVWESGTNENAVPANDNSLRTEVLTKAAIDFASAEPTDPIERDLYVVSTPWDSFSEDDVVIFIDGTWYGYTPFDGWTKLINGQLYAFTGSGGWDIFGGTGTGIVQTVVAGTGISVDSTDPENPIVSATGGVGGGFSAANCNLFPVSGSVFYLGDATHTAPAGATLSADTCVYFPFVLGEDTTLSAFGFNLTGTAASGKGRVAIYADAVTSSRHAPSGAPLVESGDLSITTTGVKTSSITQLLTNGTVYWAAVAVSSSVNMLSVSSTAIQAILGRISTANHNGVTFLTQPLTPGWTNLPTSPGSFSQGTSARPLVYANF